MVKKFGVVFLLVFIIVTCLSLNANALEINFSDEISSLEKLAAQQLYVYGILDEVPEELNYQMTRGEAVKIIYNMIPGKKESIAAPFIDSPGEYEKYINYFYSAGIVNGCTDGLFHPEQPIKQHHFLYILLKSFDTDVTFENLDNKLVELGISKINNGFSAGSIYILISDFVEAQNLKYDAVKSQISLPRIIQINVYSVEDGLEKLERCFKFGPEKININYFNEQVAIDFGTLIIDNYSSWCYNLGDTFLFPEIFDSRLGSRFTYETEPISEKIEEYKQYSNDLWFRYVDGEIDIPEYLYLRGLNKFLIAGNKLTATLGNLNFERNIYINANAANWIDCLGNEYEEKANKIFADIEEFKTLSDCEKIVKINEYIINNASYDYLEAEKSADDQMYDYNEESHSILGFINSGKIVCDGYSETFHWLMNYLDVLTLCINGRTDGIEHQWNKVLLDGKWYNIDVCWNDTGFNYYKYFLKGDGAFKNTHEIVHNYTHEKFAAYEDHFIMKIVWDF